MLAAILANLQNVPLVEVPSTIKIDRGGGGPLWGPGYDVVDILAAVQSFPEIAGEHPVARAVRRTRWIGEALPKIKEAREKREAAAFIAGASLADAAAEERHRQAEAAAEARRKLVDQLKIEQLVEIIDEARTPAAPKALSRGQSAGGTSPGAMIFALGIGVAIGVMLTRSSSGRRRRALV